MTTTTQSGTDSCLEKLHKDAATRKTEADQAARQAELLRTQSDQLTRLVGQLDTSLSSYADARKEMDPLIVELRSRLDAIRKDLECKLTSECVDALRKAFGEYPTKLGAKRTDEAKLALCQDDTSIPGRQVLCDAARAARDAVQAAIDALLTEADGLRQRVAAITAAAAAIEVIVCDRDGDRVRAYVMYLVTKANLDSVYNSVDWKKADVQEALACRLDELQSDLKKRSDELSTCAEALAELVRSHDLAVAELEAMTRNGGIDWIVDQARPACAADAGTDPSCGPADTSGGVTSAP